MMKQLSSNNRAYALLLTQKGKLIPTAYYLHASLGELCKTRTFSLVLEETQGAWEKETLP